MQKYFDNLKLISDGYMSTRLLQDSIALMETQKGKTSNRCFRTYN